MPRYLSIILALVGLVTLSACDGAVTRTTGNQTHNGELKSGDGQLESGEFCDEYPINGKAGDRFILTLNSDDFDTYLMFVNDDMSWQMENDDTVNEDFSVSQLVATLPSDGKYAVIVTSFEPGETGAYELTIESLGTSAE